MVDDGLDLTQYIQKAVRLAMDVYPYLNRDAQRLAAKQFGSYDALRADYFSRIYDTVLAYLDGEKPITLYRNSIINLMTDYFQESAELGYEAGGAALPLDDATQGLIDGAIAAEKGHVQDMFVNLRDNSIAEYTSEALSRAEGYSSGIDSIYNLGKLSAVGNQMLTFDGDDGKESCPDCQRLKGQRHRASWWIDQDLVPRPGNDNFECKGYNCQHQLYDDDGDVFTQ